MSLPTVPQSTALMKSGIDLSNYDTSPTTSEGYPIGAKSLADWIWKNFGKPTVIYASPTDFINNSNNKTGIFYQNTPGGINHIDIWNKGIPGSGIYQSKDVWFWDIK